MTTPTISVAISRDANSSLDNIAKRTGLTKLFLASTAIKMFFDPQYNQRLEDAIRSFEDDRRQAEEAFISRLLESDQGAQNAKE